MKELIKKVQKRTGLALIDTIQYMLLNDEYKKYDEELFIILNEIKQAR